jgi:hypothetical protein
MIHWTEITVKTHELKPLSNNPRKITQEKLEFLKSSIDELGYIDRVVIDHDGTVLSGNQRIKVINEDQIKVLKPSRALTDKERNQVVLRLNKHQGEWDFDLLANEFDIDELLSAGFSDKELRLDEVQEVDLPELNTGEPDCQQVTFVLSNEQKDLVDEAMAKAKKEEDCKDEINKNSNGNILAAIMRRYVYG